MCTRNALKVIQSPRLCGSNDRPVATWIEYLIIVIQIAICNELRNAHKHRSIVYSCWSAKSMNRADSHRFAIFGLNGRSPSIIGELKNTFGKGYGSAWSARSAESDIEIRGGFCLAHSNMDCASIIGQVTKCVPHRYRPVYDSLYDSVCNSVVNFTNTLCNRKQVVHQVSESIRID